MKTKKNYHRLRRPTGVIAKKKGRKKPFTLSSNLGNVSKQSFCKSVRLRRRSRNLLVDNGDSVQEPKWKMDINETTLLNSDSPSFYFTHFSICTYTAAFTQEQPLSYMLLEDIRVKSFPSVSFSLPPTLFLVKKGVENYLSDLCSRMSWPSVLPARQHFGPSLTLKISFSRSYLQFFSESAWTSNVHGRFPLRKSKKKNHPKLHVFEVWLTIHLSLDSDYWLLWHQGHELPTRLLLLGLFPAQKSALVNFLL